MIKCVTTAIRLTFYCNNSISTDSDIAQTISTLSHQFPKVQEIITTEDIANAAMIKTTIDVGKNLFINKNLLATDAKFPLTIVSLISTIPSNK